MPNFAALPGFVFRILSGRFLTPHNSDANGSIANAVGLNPATTNCLPFEIADGPAFSPVPSKDVVPESGFVLGVVAPGIPIYGRGKMRKLRP